MERVPTRSRSSSYDKRINRDSSPFLASVTPYVSIMIGSLLAIFPIATGLPFVPPLGFLLLIAWRMLRPGLLPVWAGFPLGMFDDLFSGQPFGSAITLWSAAMIAIEVIETRFPWRSFVLDWFSASIIIVAYILVGALFSGASITQYMIGALIPQLVLSLLLYPIFARLVARLDRFRLMPVRVLG